MLHEAAQYPHGPDQDQLLGFIKAIAVRGIHKEVHRAAFHSTHQQQGELYQAYIAKLKAEGRILPVYDGSSSL